MYIYVRARKSNYKINTENYVFVFFSFFIGGGSRVRSLHTMRVVLAR